jgi:hypothetical protein
MATGVARNDNTLIKWLSAFAKSFDGQALTLANLISGKIKKRRVSLDK